MEACSYTLKWLNQMGNKTPVISGVIKKWFLQYGFNLSSEEFVIVCTRHFQCGSMMHGIWNARHIFLWFWLILDGASL
jgi:hypothetical protein